MPVLSVLTHHDDLLGVVAPLVVAATHQTALVVDLDPVGARLPTRRSLAELVSEGPTRAELSPTKTGLAVLGNGGVTADESADVVAALCDRWPAVVLRVRCETSLAPTVHVVPGLVSGPAPSRSTIWVGGPERDRVVVRRPPRRAFHAAFEGRRLTGVWQRSWWSATRSMWR